MKKKGFTLVELLVTIAILAILVLLVIPNVINLFNKAKEKSFVNELKDIYKAAQTQYVKDTVTGGRVIEYARVTEEVCDNTINLSGREDLDFLIKFNEEGKVVLFRAYDGSYQYTYEGEGLEIDELTNAVDVSDIGDYQVVSVTCDSDPGTNFYTSSIHLQEEHEFIAGYLDMKTTLKELKASTNDRVFMRYKINDYSPSNITVWCMESSDGKESCSNMLDYYQTKENCLADMQNNDSEYTYTCKAKDAKYFEGEIPNYSLGYIMNDKTYFVKMSNKADLEKTYVTVLNSFGIQNCYSSYNEENRTQINKAKSNRIITLAKILGIPVVRADWGAPAYQETAVPQVFSDNDLYCKFGNTEAVVLRNGIVAVKYKDRVCSITGEYSGCLDYSSYLVNPYRINEDVFNPYNYETGILK